MRPPLKLNSIDQEHLQELYNAGGVARDELPYSAEFETLWQGFQDRTFKNADREQLFGALLKYVRSGGNASKPPRPTTLTEEQLKQAKQLLARHGKAGKVLPYSEELETARKEFAKAAGIEVTPDEFWHAIVRIQGAKRRPPVRKKVAVPDVDGDDGAEDEE